MKLASFDLEIAKEIPEGADWLDVRPLGISCAAVALEGDRYIWWQSAPDKLAMTADECLDMVLNLKVLVDNGYTLVTWNGCSFDFQVLAEESGWAPAVARMCLHHIDMMLPVVFQKGHYLGLDKVLQGIGLAGKTHSVTLTDGTTLDGMGGAMAPKLWKAGERAAVLAYLDGDVSQTLALATRLRDNPNVSWLSNKERRNYVRIPLQTVAEVYAHGYPIPDTSWMQGAPTREQFIEWMPELVGLET